MKRESDQRRSVRIAALKLSLSMILFGGGVYFFAGFAHGLMTPRTIPTSEQKLFRELNIPLDLEREVLEPLRRVDRSEVQTGGQDILAVFLLHIQACTACLNEVVDYTATLQEAAHSWGLRVQPLLLLMNEDEARARQYALALESSVDGLPIDYGVSPSLVDKLIVDGGTSGQQIVLIDTQREKIFAAWSLSSAVSPAARKLRVLGGAFELYEAHPNTQKARPGRTR